MQQASASSLHPGVRPSLKDNTLNRADGHVEHRVFTVQHPVQQLIFVINARIAGQRN